MAAAEIPSSARDMPVEARHGEEQLNPRSHAFAAILAEIELKGEPGVTSAPDTCPGRSDNCPRPRLGRPRPPSPTTKELSTHPNV